MGQAEAIGGADVARSALRRVTNHIAVFLAFCYFVSYMDRVNVGFAKLTMDKALGISDTMYGWGAGIFFIAYFVFGVPSNFFLQKFGARLWIGALMIAWGVASIGMAFITGPVSFLVVRFLVGMAEAGFYPGVILYLTYWFPRANRAKIVGIVSLSGPISTFLGSPISGALLDINGVLHMDGWQWLFILESLPAVVLGALTFMLLPNHPDEARWLPPEERAWLKNELEMDRAREQAKAPIEKVSWGKMLTQAEIWVLGFAYGGATVSTYGLQLWLPTIVKEYNLTNIQTGFVTSVPFGFAALGMVLWGRHSDQTGERLWHTALALIFTAVGLTASIFLHSLVPVMAAFVVAAVAANSLRGPFWALSTEWMSAGTLAAGAAAINAIGNLGGFAGPFVIGWIKDTTHSNGLAVVPLVGMGLAAAASLFLMNAVRERRAQPEPARAAAE